MSCTVVHLCVVFMSDFLLSVENSSAGFFAVENTVVFALVFECGYHLRLDLCGFVKKLKLCIILVSVWSSPSLSFQGPELIYLKAIRDAIAFISLVSYSLLQIMDIAE